MPLGGVYDTGTVAVTNGSTAVVGTGVFWPDVLEGDHLVIGGLLSLIASVDTGASTLTLMKPYQGATNGAAAYQLVKMSWLRYDPSTVMFQVRALLAKLNDAGLIYYTTGVPDPAIGENGDLAINTAGPLWVFYTKAAGVWVLQDAVVSAADGFNVADFGAVSDGVTNDLPAVNAAIAAANAVGGGEVLFPVGTTYVTASIVVSNPNITLRGVVPGGACRIKIPNSFTGTVVYVSGSGCTVSDLTIDQNNATGAADPALVMNGIAHSAFRRCRIAGMSRSGINVSSCTEFIIDDCDVVMDTPISTVANRCINLATNQNGIVSNNRCVGGMIETTGGDRIMIINNIVRGLKYGSAISVFGSSHYTVRGNIVNTGRPGVTDASGGPVAGMQVGGTFHVISENTVYDFDGAGIVLFCDDSVIQNNLIADVGKLTSYVGGRAGITAQYLSGSAGFGASRNLIQGNKVSQSAGLTDIQWGYSEIGAVTDNYLIDNRLVGTSGPANVVASTVYRTIEYGST